MKLYSYYRSSCSYRVRIALNLKGLDYEYLPVNIVQGEQKGDAYLAHNPQGLVPALQLDGGDIIGQSTAILEWLEENHPAPALLPGDSLQRARVRALTQSIACDIQPLNNIAILNYLKRDLGASDAAVNDWYTAWIRRGFDAVEHTLASSSGDFCFGDQPGLADCYLVPQVYNADRFGIDTQDYRHIRRIYDHCLTLAAFARAAPEAQPDAAS
ncbi:maleylacetoacetate isomerase [Haliea sp. E17]|uniref:maleylacetoacetate isomerase n=1 Tax=Haliea sp. E17 TaxID=3401576 RepID=UPI003AAC2B89